MHLWLKAFHLIAMVAWFAALFYMFRLFVYHAENRDEPETAAVLKTMAERLYRIIGTPAMVATWVFGLAMLVSMPSFLRAPWLHAKLLLVVGLTGYHFYLGYVRRRFAADDVFLTSRQCRMRNEIPTLFLIGIVLLAVLRPGN
jgi:putative membrane protein